MKKSLLPFFMAASLALDAAAAAEVESGDVSTSASIGGGVTYFEEEDHPTKMVWENWTFCWGADASSKTENLESHGFSGRGTSGTIEDDLRVGGPLGHMLVSKMQWDTQFDKKDMVFHVNIHRRVGPRREAQVRSTCTTHDWTYKVNKLSAVVSTSVNLKVPANVYVMRIKTLSNHSGNEAVISRARPMPENESGKVSEETNFKLDGYQYFFTRPGEDFNIALNINDSQVRDLDVVASYEVTFVGQNRCDQAVRDVFGDAPLLTTQNLTARVRDTLTAIETGIGTNAGAEELHKPVLFIGCLMNRDVADGLLYNNDAGQIQGLMSEVQSFQERVNDKTIRSDAYKKVGDAMKLLTHMSIASLQANVLDGIKPFCERLPVFDGKTGEKIGNERGFIKIGRDLKQARNLLGSTGFSGYYARLLAVFEEAKANGKNYDQIMNDESLRPHVIELAKLFQADSKVLVAHRMTGLLTGLPDLRPTANSVRMASAAQNIERITGRLHDRFAREIEHFIARSEITPETTGVDGDIRALADAERDFRDSATRLIALVDSKEGGYVTSEFTKATEKIVTSGSRGWLASVYQGYFADYLAGIDPDFKAAREAKAVDEAGSYERKTIAEVQKCLVGFSSINE